MMKQNMQEDSASIFYFSDLTEKMYNVNYTALDLSNAPFNGAIAQLEAGASSNIQNHFEKEVFLFLSGEGVFRINEQKITIHPGLGVRIPPFVNHGIQNTSTTQPLRFLSLYWGDNLNESLTTNKKMDEINEPATLIFSPLATPNGDLHLGHLSGPYLASDVYRRYLSEKGVSVKHVTGRDDHQSYVAKKAAANNMAPEKFADQFAAEINQTLAASGITVDYHITPDRDGDYATFVKTIFQQFYDQGIIFEKEDLAAFNATEDYLHDAHIHGHCPFCQQASDGNVCETCGRPNACTHLLHAKDAKTNLAPALRPCKRLYFNFNSFNQQLTDYIKSITMPAHALSLSLSMLHEGLPDICVSHPGTWGIKTPVAGFQDQVIYVWFELALSYLWGARQLSPAHLSDDQKTTWFYNNPDTRVIHFYGFDNTYYHTLFFPAIYFALRIKPSSVHNVNELLNLEGRKFSTSRNHTINGRDFMNRVPLDYMRWFLCEIRPEGSQQDFTLHHFARSINDTFHVTLNQWITKLATIITEKYNRTIPEPGAWTTEQRHFLQIILSHQQTALTYFKIETFSTPQLIATLKALSLTALRFFDAQHYLFATSIASPYTRTAIALSALALKIFALLARPIIPDTANLILNAMNIPRETLLTEAAFINASTECSFSLFPTFTKISEEM